MAISIRLKEQDEKLFKSYAKTNNMSLSELFRSAVLKKLKMNMTLPFIEKLWKNIIIIQSVILMKKYVRC